MILDTDKIIVPNWFEKDDIETLIGDTLTDEQYISLQHWVEGTNWDDEISGEMREIYRDWQESQENENSGMSSQTEQR